MVFKPTTFYVMHLHKEKLDWLFPLNTSQNTNSLFGEYERKSRKLCLSINLCNQQYHVHTYRVKLKSSITTIEVQKVSGCEMSVCYLKRKLKATFSFHFLMTRTYVEIKG